MNPAYLSNIQALLKIRLSRTGKRTQASYRVVVQEHTAPIKGKFVEVLGTYVPTSDPKEFKINSERVKYWLSVGAQPSDSVAALLKKDGFEGMDDFLEPRNKKRKKKKEVDEPEAPAAPAAEAAPAEAPAEEKAEEAAPEAPAVEDAPAEDSN